MKHDGQSDTVCYRPSNLHDLEVVAQIAAPATDADLDTENPVAMGSDRPDGCLTVDHRRVEIQFVSDHQPDRRDVQQRIDSSGRRVNDVLAKTLECVRPRGSAVERGRDARLEPDDV